MLGALQRKYDNLAQCYVKLNTLLQTAERRETLLLQNVIITLSEAVQEAACLADQVCFVHITLQCIVASLPVPTSR